MVESTGLENRNSRKAIEGSNPSPSAHLFFLPMYFIYVLWSTNLHKRYVGTVDNVKKVTCSITRESSFTFLGIPWTLLQSESFSTLSETRKREYFLNSGGGRTWLDGNIPTP